MRYFILILILVCGCTWQTEPEPYREKLPTDTVADLLIDEFEIRFGNLTDRCKMHIHNVMYVDRGERIFGEGDLSLGVTNSKALGEHFYDGISYIWIEKSLTPLSYNTFLVHELIHALLSCESDPHGTGLGDGDGDHNEPNIWCTTGNGCHWDGHDNLDSLEYAVATAVRYYD